MVASYHTIFLYDVFTLTLPLSRSWYIHCEPLVKAYTLKLFSFVFVKVRRVLFRVNNENDDKKTKKKREEENEGVLDEEDRVQESWQVKSERERKRWKNKKKKTTDAHKVSFILCVGAIHRQFFSVIYVVPGLGSRRIKVVPTMFNT